MTDRQSRNYLCTAQVQGGRYYTIGPLDRSVTSEKSEREGLIQGGSCLSFYLAKGIRVADSFHILAGCRCGGGGGGTNFEFEAFVGAEVL